MIKAEIVLDSISKSGNRITTLILDYPRFIHSEFLTHRVFSRNSASSRAVPTKKMIERVLHNPAEPIEWGSNNAGMQSKSLMGKDDAEKARMIWYKARHQIVGLVEEMAELNPHKQIINRLLEPWLHMQTVVTATEWDNFFSLRCHPDAQPEIKVLAEAMRDVMNNSKPQELAEGEWHIPFINSDEKELDLSTKLKVSTARCARTSYYVHGTAKISLIEDDIKLYNKLVNSKPIHASPTEHQAKAMPYNDFHANFRGWLQYRKYIELNEKV